MNDQVTLIPTVTNGWAKTLKISLSLMLFVSMVMGGWFVLKAEFASASAVNQQFAAVNKNMSLGRVTSELATNALRIDVLEDRVYRLEKNGLDHVQMRKLEGQLRRLEARQIELEKEKRKLESQ